MTVTDWKLSEIDRDFLDFHFISLQISLNNIKEAKKNLDIAWNHFQNADAPFVHAAIMDLNRAERNLDVAVNIFMNQAEMIGERALNGNENKG